MAKHLCEHASADVVWSGGFLPGCPFCLELQSVGALQAKLDTANAKLLAIAKAARATPDWLAVCRALVADVMNLGSHSVTCRQSVQDAREAVAAAEEQEQERIAGGRANA